MGGCGIGSTKGKGPALCMRGCKETGRVRGCVWARGEGSGAAVERDWGVVYSNPKKPRPRITGGGSIHPSLTSPTLNLLVPKPPCPDPLPPELLLQFVLVPTTTITTTTRTQALHARLTSHLALLTPAAALPLSRVVEAAAALGGQRLVLAEPGWQGPAMRLTLNVPQVGRG